MPTPPLPALPPLTGLILAGGRGTRLGGVDKGLVELHGRPLVEYVLERLRPQTGAILINANRHHERYAAYGVPVIPDLEGGFAGPLAGIAAGLAKAVKIALPLNDATKVQYDRMVELGIGGLDKSGIAELTFPGRTGTAKKEKKAGKKDKKK